MLGEKVAKQEKGKHRVPAAPRTLTAHSPECGLGRQQALPTGLRKASGGCCSSWGQSDGEDPFGPPTFGTQTTWPPHKRREGARSEQVYLLNREQLGAHWPRAGGQPKHLHSPEGGEDRCSSPGHTEASLVPLPLMRLAHLWWEHGSLGDDSSA